MKREYLPSLVPQKPGVYVFRDKFGKVIYVGKAKNLRKRLGNYFQPSRVAKADAKTRSLIHSIDDWAVEEVRNEEEALILESRLIKDYAPKYNILMRDDKRYPLLKINLNEDFPTLKKARFKRNDDSTYFGPFPHGSALQFTLEFLLAYFKLRSCKDENPTLDTMKRCLKRIVKDCSAPCMGNISKEDYRKNVDAMLEVLNGKTDKILADIDSKMSEAARNLKFEKASRYRDVKENLLAVFGDKKRQFENVILPNLPLEGDPCAELAKALGLPKIPSTIVGFDISNIMGTLAVGSMVFFRDGKPERKSYRRFKIKTVEGSNDFAMMQEVFRRYFGRILRENLPHPDLVMVDGGKGQLHAAIETLKSINFPPLPIIGLAKREEEIFIPGRSEPILLSRHNIGLRLLQALRDEAHRFAISFHKELRHNLLELSVLDEISGVGKIRKKELLKNFGSIAELKKASPEEIHRKVPNINIALAEKILDILR